MIKDNKDIVVDIVEMTREKGNGFLSQMKEMATGGSGRICMSSKKVTP